MKQPIAPHVKIGDVGSLHFRVVMHFDSLFEVFWFDPIFILSRGLYVSGIRSIDDFDWYARVVVFEESFLSQLLCLHRQKEALILILYLHASDDVQTDDEQDEECYHTYLRNTF